MESEMTRMYKNKRWWLWLHYFIAGIIAVVILSLIYNNATTQRELSDFKIEAKPAIEFYKEYKPFIENSRKERESIMNLPVVPGI